MSEPTTLAYTSRGHLGLGLLFLIGTAIMLAVGIGTLATRGPVAFVWIAAVIVALWTLSAVGYLRRARGRLELATDALRLSGKTIRTIPFAALRGITVEDGRRATLAFSAAPTAEVARALRALDLFAFQGARSRAPRATIVLTPADCAALVASVESHGVPVTRLTD